MRVLLRVNSHVICSSRENKGWIIQIRVFVFTLHHKESKMKMKLILRIGLAPFIFYVCAEFLILVTSC